MLMTLLSAALAMFAVTQPTLPPLTPKDRQLLNPQGKPVILKGVNLGNWLLIEPWMLNWTDVKDPLPDQYEIERTLAERFGEDERQRLMELYRTHWISERDFPIIKSFGFNVVRLPINYRLLEDDNNPYVLKPEAFKWLDHAVELAAKNGIYTILDMHGAQGGQTPNDHTGRSGQNKIWSEPENPKRLAWLWSKIAARYKDNPNVVAYDTLNEPYGGTYSKIKEIFEMCYQSIRKVDPDKLIFAHGFYDGFTFFGTPKENSWHNVGFQMHHYPGLFGSEPSRLTHAKHLSFLDGVQFDVKRFNSNFLIGEMNVVFESVGGGPLMRRYYDKHAELGWHTTMWSYKVHQASGGIGPDSWGMVGNKNPLPPLSIRTASKEEIESLFKSFSTMPYAINEPLRSALTAKIPPLVNLPKVPEPRRTAPQGTLNGWKVTDIGGSLKGGLEVKNGEVVLYGGGNDIWATQDSFRFLHQSISGNFTLTTQVTSIESIETYTKAGLMVRANTENESPHFLLSSFPTGELQVAWRTEEGSITESHDPKLTLTPPKLFVQISRTGDLFIAKVSNDGNNWKTLHQVAIPGFPKQALVGPVALSHDNYQLAKITYRSLKITK
jgi:endoglucanase